eukprot:6175081-Pleurochrysis_carterae.AAC.6
MYLVSESKSCLQPPAIHCHWQAAVQLAALQDPPRLQLRMTSNRRGGAVYPLTIMRLKLTVATTTVVHKVSVVYSKGMFLEQQTCPATPKAHDYTVVTEAKSPLDHSAAMR